MAKELRPTEVLVTPVRFSYVNIFRSRAFTQGGTEKYSICLLLPKTETKMKKRLDMAIAAAKQEGAAKKWSGKIPKNCKEPIRDGDEERAEEAPEYAGMWFFNATSSVKPTILDANGNEILDPDDVYSGCWGKALINFYPFDTNGNRGVAAGLEAVSRRKPPYGQSDERLGGGKISLEDAADLMRDEDEDVEDFG